jgi:hypothetical protein
VQTVVLKNLLLGGYKDIHGNEVRDRQENNYYIIAKLSSILQNKLVFEKKTVMIVKK